MLRINPTLNEIRLESGNHRVWLAKKYNVGFLPVATFVTNRVIFHEGNGLHKYPLPTNFNKTNLVRCPYDYPIMLSSYLDFNQY